MKKILSIIILVILIGCGLYLVNSLKATTILISNATNKEISNIKLETRNNSIEVGTILPHESKTIVLPHRFGESSITMQYNDRKVWHDGYIEDGYKVNIIYSELGIEYKLISLPNF